MLLKLQATNQVNVFNIISNTLSTIDDRLINHGERVAYIMLKMAQSSKREYSKHDLSNICWIGLLHDIGAYKTEEISNMVEFETNTVNNHSAYGYSILHNVSPFRGLADAVLYHHLEYTDFDLVLCENELLAQAIYVADRFDISKFDIDRVRCFSGSKFNPLLVAELETAIDNYNIIDKLKSSEYKAELYSYVLNEFNSAKLKEAMRMIVYPIDFQVKSEGKSLPNPHSSHVALLSALLAKQAGLSDLEISDIYLSGALHDIGLVGRQSNTVETTLKILKGNVSDSIYNIISGSDKDKHKILETVNNISKEVKLETDIEKVKHIIQHTETCTCIKGLINSIGVDRVAKELVDITKDIEALYKAISNDYIKYSKILDEVEKQFN